MKKSVVVIICMVLAMLLFLNGCQGTPTEEKKETVTKEYTLPERLQETESQAQLEKQPEPLVICVDIFSEPFVLETGMMDLIVPMQSAGKLGEVEVDYIPVEGGSRTSVLNRIRTELMSGKGPDLFIVKCADSYGQEESLFPMPEKIMASGLFLPLDPYIENNAAYAEWDKLTKSVMDAGRNEEGQQIVPLAYTMPALFYRAEDVPFTPTEGMTWREMAEDETLHDAAMLLGAGPKDYLYSDFEGYYNHRLQYILGDLADYAEEELLFTEEALLAYVEETVAISEEVWQEKLYDRPN